MHIKGFAIVVLCFVGFGMAACNPFDKAKNIAKGASRAVVNVIFPIFDEDMPDTKYNKKRFEDFCKVELTEDVKDIYAHDDAPVGLDQDYQIAFSCNAVTAGRIIANNNMRLDSNALSATGLQTEFTWWPKAKLDTLTPYVYNKGEYYKYFWYDSITTKGYLLDFDM